MTPEKCKFRHETKHGSCFRDNACTSCSLALPEIYSDQFEDLCDQIWRSELTAEQKKILKKLIDFAC